MTAEDSFPRLSARTRRFTLGEPRTFTFCADGSRLLFLRSMSGTDARTGLWCLDLPDGDERLVVDPRAEVEANLPAEERARRERVRETATGVVAYSADAAGAVVVFAMGGELQVVDVASGAVRRLPAQTPVYDPRIDPIGRTIAYVHDRVLRLIDSDGGNDRQLCGEDSAAVSWGRAEHAAAEEMNRSRGFWWAPDGTSLLVARVDESEVPQLWVADPAHPFAPPMSMRYPTAGSANADVSLHSVLLTGESREVHWDRSALPYLARVTWSSGHPPLLQVQARDQRRIATLIVDLAAGTTAIACDDTDPVWVEVFDGVPGWCGGDIVRIADRDGQRRLLIGDAAGTTADVYVRAVVDATDDAVLFTASYDDPTQVHVARWTRDGVERLTADAGVHSATASGDAVVIGSTSLDYCGARHEMRSAGAVRRITSNAQQPPLRPNVRMLSLGPRSLRAGLLLPRDHVAGTALPLLVDPYGGPHVQRVLAGQRLWLEPQWLADQGFAVLVCDGRGTPGRDLAWERAIHHDFASVLDDQVEAVEAVVGIEADIDVSRVAIRGWSFGGYLAALAVLRRPDVFHAAVAGAPVTDWALYDTHYTERYLGTPQNEPEVYARNSLLEDAAALKRPLLIIHGLADDNVVAAHTLRLSQRLTEAGRAHSVLPLTGVTHMTPQEAVAENLMLLQVEFLRAALSG